MKTVCPRKAMQPYVEIEVGSELFAGHQDPEAHELRPVFFGDRDVSGKGP